MGRPEKTKQVTVYLPLDVAKKLERIAVLQRRKMGPMVLDILYEFFALKAQQEAKDATLVR